jgi:hypothetical protein
LAALWSAAGLTPLSLVCFALKGGRHPWEQQPARAERKKERKKESGVKPAALQRAIRAGAYGASPN